MICDEIMKLCEELAPLDYAMGWDRKNDGLQLGDRSWKVSRIYLALDASDEVIEDALEKGADMLITHHPMIFGGINQINSDSLIGRRLLKLAEHKISYLAMHTNFDVACMADEAADYLQLADREVLETVLTDEEGEKGIGKVGRLPKKMTLRALCEEVKKQFCLDNVKVFGDLDAEVERAAISPGSGKDMTGPALVAHADVLITGDIDHHTGIDAVADSLFIIDAGHYGLEHIFTDYMYRFLKDRLDPSEGIEVIQEPLKIPFFIV